MRMIVLVHASEDSEAGVMLSTELLTSMGAYSQALIEAGIMRDGAGLRSTCDGVRVRFDGDSRTVSRGPFNLISDLVSGYWIWEVKDMAEAIAWLKRCPNPHFEAGEVEIRPLYGPEDFIEWGSGSVVGRRAIQPNFRQAVYCKTWLWNAGYGIVGSFALHKQVIETTSLYNRSLYTISIVGLNDE